MNKDTGCKGNSNIFVVYTPLHVLIASSIVTKENLKNVHIIGFVDGSKKTVSYCNDFRSMANSMLLVNYYRGIRSVLTIILIINYLMKINTSSPVLYVGSIKSFYARIVLAALGKNVIINTFDDGYGNVIKHGYLHEDDKKLKKIVVSLFGKRLCYTELIKCISTHYTIFDLPNVYGSYCNKIIKVPLTYRSLDVAEIKPDRKCINLLLTAPFSEHGIINLTEEIEIYKNAILIADIEYRLRHPAENLKKDEYIDVCNLETNLVAEELVVNLSRHVVVNLYAFGSTSLLNLCATDNVRCFWLRSAKTGMGYPPDELKEKIVAIEVHV